MAVPAVFFALLMFATAGKTQGGGAAFRNTKVTLTCPEKGDWYEGDSSTKTTPENSQTFTFDYKQKVKYRCEYPSESSSQKKYYFFVQGRVCQNCFELDAKFFVVVIVVDLIGTAVVMMIIYKCSKKKSSDKPPPTPKPPSRTGNRPGYGPSEYESLNLNTRGTDTYSTVVNNGGIVNRTG